MRNTRILSFLKNKVNSTLLSNSLKWWFIAFSSLMITRIIFTLVNSDQFKSIPFSDFLYGTWIDAITSSLFLFPYLALLFIFIFFIPNKWIVKISNVLIGILILFFTLTNLIDTAYFKFQFARSNYDLFETIFERIDLKGQFGGIFASYWWLFLVFILFIYLLFRLLNRWIDKSSNQMKISNAISFAIFLGVVFLLGRGGVRPRPIGIIDLSRYSKNSQLIGNTPFFILKTAGTNKMPNYNFLSKNDAAELTNFIKTSNPQNILPDSTNVVVIVMESFGKEVVVEKKITPFFNSLSGKSWSLKTGFANGYTSMEAIPAILASMPTFSQTNYISSMHSSNKLDGIPSILKEQGYSTTFFHGATNGSMNFDAYSSSSGYDSYEGRNEFANDDYFDGSWGIFDDAFLPWCVEKMSKLKEPFHGTVFSLSSHHPYLIPENLQSKFPFENPIESATAYADYSLQQFFELAKKQSWYENTLFVILADHTSTYRGHNGILESYDIPILFFHPTVDLTQIKIQPVACQMDVFPTVLDLLNIKRKFYSAGKSLFDDSPSWIFVKSRDKFLHISDNQTIWFQVDEMNNLIIFTSEDWKGKKIKGTFEKETKEMKAFLQQITADVKSNKTSS